MTDRDLRPHVVLLALIGLGLGGCGSMMPAGQRYAATTNERECLARAMYFESNRSSPDGMLAVGTVVMNRLEDPAYPKTICGVVGQRNQFAPGAMTEPMTSRALPKVFKVADAVIGGARHPSVGKAKFFHTAGYRFPYRNMHYVTLAGGNMFYDKRRNPTQTQTMIARLEGSQRRVALAALETPIPSSGTMTDATPIPVAAEIPDQEDAPAAVAAPKPVRTRARAEEPAREPVRTPRSVVVVADAPKPAAPRLAALPPKPLVVAAVKPAKPAPAPVKVAARETPKDVASRTIPVALAPPSRPGAKGAKDGAPSFSAQSIATLLAKYDPKKDGAKPTKVSTLRRTISAE